MPHMNLGTLRTGSVAATMPCAGASSSAAVSAFELVFAGAGVGVWSCGCDEHDKSEPVRGRLATSRARTERGRFGDRIVILRQRDFYRLVNEGLRCGATKRGNIAPFSDRSPLTVLPP